MKQKKGWQQLYGEPGKPDGTKGIPGFSGKNRFDAWLFYIADVHLEWRKIQPGGPFIWCYVDLDMPDMSFYLVEIVELEKIEMTPAG